MNLFIRKDVICSIETCRVTERNQSIGAAWSEDAFRAESGTGDLKGSGCRLNLSRELIGGDGQGSESTPALGSGWRTPASKVKRASCSVVSNSVTPWTAACQAPLSVEFSRQEFWSGFPSPGDLSHPGMESESPTLQADSLPSESPGNGQNKSPGEGLLLAPVDHRTACTSTVVNLEVPGASLRKHQKQADRA